MKKKLILMCIAGALVMTAVIGGTLAGFNTTTQENQGSGVTDIKVNKLDIGVSGDNLSGDTDELRRIIISEPAVPGGDVSFTRKLDNLGKYDVYVRVIANIKWEDNLPVTDIVSVGIDDKENEWFCYPAYEAGDEQITMYRKAAVTVGQKEVAIPINKISFDPKMNNTYAEKKIEIAFTVDAVQAAAAEDSMPSEWGVYPVFDADGNLEAIEE